MQRKVRYKSHGENKSPVPDSFSLPSCRELLFSLFANISGFICVKLYHDDVKYGNDCPLHFVRIMFLSDFIKLIGINLPSFDDFIDVF